MELDQRDIIGYSIPELAAKQDWIGFVEAIEAAVASGGLQHQILFHGSSEIRRRAMLSEGHRPTHLDAAVLGQDRSMGSFWGTVRTAAAYAEDTARERDECRPRLMAVRVSDLVEHAELFADLQTLDFPLRGLTRLDDRAVSQKWHAQYETLSWQESLADLGAVAAVHDDWLPGDILHGIDSLEDLLTLIPEATPIPR